MQELYPIEKWTVKMCLLTMPNISWYIYIRPGTESKNLTFLVTNADEEKLNRLWCNNPTLYLISWSSPLAIGEAIKTFIFTNLIIRTWKAVNILIMIEQNKKRLTYNQFDQRQFYASMNRTFNHQHLNKPSLCHL